MVKNEQKDVQIDYVSEVERLKSELTKRNEAYMYELNKALTTAGMDGGKMTEINYYMMKELVAHQKSGKTAKQLFGTVSQRAKHILEGPKEDLSKPSEPWKIYMDGALLMGSLFMLISAITSSQQLGITSLILNYFIAGFAILLVTRAAQNYQVDAASQQKRWVSLFKYIGLTLLSMVTWLGGMILVSLIPVALNPILPQIVYLIIGGTTLALKFYLKRKLNIRGGIF